MNYLKKLFYFSTCLAILAGLVSVPLVMASGSPAFNNIVGDQAFLQGFNVTTNSALQNPVQAVAGDIVEVVVYYHNTVAGSVANNTRIQISLPTNVGTTHLISGSLSADNASTVTETMVNGQVVGGPNFIINSNNETSLAFVPGSVRWYPDEMKTLGSGANLPNGQTGDTIVSSGINIGNLSGCFQYSGSVYFQVQLKGIANAKISLAIQKNERLAGSSNAYVQKLTNILPGSTIQYQVSVQNLDTTNKAQNVIVQDTLPGGMSYVIGSSLITYSNGTTKALADGVTSGSGIIADSSLNPRDSFILTFQALTAKTLTNNTCLVNTAMTNADNALSLETANASICFQVLIPTVALSIEKDVRRAPSTDAFISQVLANPGNQLEYSITVRNLDGSVAAQNINIQDSLPNGLSYVGPTILHLSNGTTTILPDGIVSPSGIRVDASLAPSDYLEVTFLVVSASNLQEGNCLINEAVANSPTAKNSVTASATVCFTIPLVASPTPIVTTVIPTPYTSPVAAPASPLPMTSLPQTGPEGEMILISGISGAGLGVIRYQKIKWFLKKSLRKIDIL